VVRRSRLSLVQRHGVVLTSCVSMSLLVSFLESFFGVTHYVSFLDYLDRESLAARIEALKVFEGGVLVITHNRDCSEFLCKEVWAMRDGRLEASGHNWVEGRRSGLRIDKAAADDAMGNKVDSTKTKNISAADARKVSDCFYPELL
jgi:hypothetical protein